MQFATVFALHCAVKHRAYWAGDARWKMEGSVFDGRTDQETLAARYCLVLRGRGQVALGLFLGFGPFNVHIWPTA